MIKAISEGNNNRDRWQGTALGLLLIGYLLAWWFLFQDAILSAVSIWSVSEIYSHCFFVVPGVVYLVWRERTKLRSLSPKPNYWVVIPLLSVLFLEVMGVAGDIQLFTHVAAFLSLSLSIWLVVGNQVAKAIWFPLLFIVFAVPVGDELVPFLQDITADLSVILLQIVGIPIFRNGLYLDIPEGRFVVAEACSGISFLIAATAFGAIYGHLSFRKFSWKVAFLLVSVIVPILANSVRVFGIILIAHYSNMEYAAGADHLVYGWVFFAFVLFLLVLLGEALRRKENKVSEDEEKTYLANPDWLKTGFRMPLAVLVGVLLVTSIWAETIRNPSIDSSGKINIEALSAEPYIKSNDESWLPQFKGATEAGLWRLNKVMGPEIDIFIAWYASSSGDGELISSTNRLYQIEKWTRLSEAAIELKLNGERFNASELVITSPFGEKRRIIYWYQLQKINTANKLVAKLSQVSDVMIGGDGGGAIVALSQRLSSTKRSDEELVNFVNKYGSNLDRVLPWKKMPREERISSLGNDLSEAPAG